MPSLPFPDTGTRLVLINGRPAVNGRGYLYADEALTVPAEVYRDVSGVKGALIPVDEDGRVSIRLDAYGQQVDYWGPVDGQDRLWILVGGVKSRVDADYNARLDTLGARVSAVEAAAVNDSAVVHKAGAETVTGAKTFTVSPIVPATPSGPTAAAPAGYVDDAVADEAVARTAAITGALSTAASDAADQVFTHSADTTNVHGITNTAALVLTGDSRLTDARNPTAHAVSHGSAGSDPVTVAQSQVTGLSAALAAASTDATAKANAAQAAAVQRANHTGTQTSATISDFTEAAQDAIAALIGAGPNISVTYDDNANSLVITGANPGVTDPEIVRDAIGAALVGVGPINITVNDGADTITITSTATVNSTDAALRDRSTHTGTQTTSTVAGLDTALAAQQAALDLRAYAGYLPVNGNVAAGVDPTGVTECSAALQALFDAYAQVGETGAHRIVRLQGIFNISSEIVIKGSVDASAAVFNYSGSGVAVRIGNASAGNLTRLTVKIGHIICTSKTGVGWLAGSMGLVVTNVFRSTITFQHIKHFETGLAAVGDDRYGFGGTSYCTFNMGTLNNNKVNLLITRAVGSGVLGYSTQNTYIAGSYSHAEGTYPAVGQRNIKIGEIGQNLNLDNNLWLNPSIEGSMEEYLIDCNGGENMWLNPRFEFIANNPPIRWGGNANRNLIIGGYDSSNLAEVFVPGGVANNIIGSQSARFSTIKDYGFMLQTPAGGETAALTVMGPGGLVEAGANPLTAYTVRVQPSRIKLKTAGDGTDRLFLDGLNRQIVMGSGPDTTTVGLYWGPGSPEGVVTASPTSMYWDYSGAQTSTWTKRTGTGNTGWALATSPRVAATASSATPTPVSATVDVYVLSALAADATFGAPTGTPADGQQLTIRIKDDGAARTLAWNAIYRAIGVTLPTTTVIGKTTYVGCRYNSADTKWDVLTVATET